MELTSESWYLESCCVISPDENAQGGKGKVDRTMGISSLLAAIHMTRVEGSAGSSLSIGVQLVRG